jgi:hypothetical protein
MPLKKGFFLKHFALGVVYQGVLRSSHKTNLLTLLCVFALLASQAFGGVTGYLCRCGGQEVLTGADHCHGPHSEACHGDSEQAGSHVHDESSEADTENHAPVARVLELLRSDGVAVPEMIAVVVAVFSQPDFRAALRKDAFLTVLLKNEHFVRQPGVVLRQTVSLLV